MMEAARTVDGGKRHPASKGRRGGVSDDARRSRLRECKTLERLTGAGAHFVLLEEDRYSGSGLDLSTAVHRVEHAEGAVVVLDLRASLPTAPTAPTAPAAVSAGAPR